MYILGIRESLLHVEERMLVTNGAEDHVNWTNRTCSEAKQYVLSIFPQTYLKRDANT